MKLDFKHQIGEVQSRFAITYDPATEKAEAEQLLQRYAPLQLTEEGSHANTESRSKRKRTQKVD